MSSPVEPKEYIRCDCCNKVVMAEYRDGKLIILRQHHGNRHTVALMLDKSGKVKENQRVK